MTRPNWIGAFICVLGLFVAVPAVYSQAIVTYQGFLYNQFGAPVQNGRVIAGTFKPGFNVSNYNCTYGDFACNTNYNNYTQAVADGNFIPFDSGVLSNSIGLFSDTTSSTAAGSKVWIFGFPTSQTFPTDGTEALASSTDASYILPASGIITIDASKTNQFVLGYHAQGGVGLSGIPIPEPTSGAVLVLAALSLGAGRTRRRLGK